MSRLAVTLFGPPRIERNGAPLPFERRKALALLAYLAATPDPQARAILAALFWPEADDSTARASLRRALVELRQVVGAEWLLAEGEQIALPAAVGLMVDVRAFQASLAAVARHGHVRGLGSGSGYACPECLTELTCAVDLYRGDFLAGFTLKDTADFDAWQTCQTETLRLELAEALELLAEGYAGHGQPDLGLPHARRWLNLDPLCEPAHRCLMRLYAAVGDRQAALRQFAACQEALQAELSIPPEPETMALFERIKAGLLAPSPTRPVSHSPIPSVAPSPSLPRPAVAFFGREAELAHIATRLADPACRLLTLLGPGGSGKTSLALQAATATPPECFPAGICFAPLATVTSVELLPSAILQALDIQPRGSMTPQRQLLEHLADRRLLLVLDNFEHLLGGQEAGDSGQGAEDGAGLVVEILRAAPGVKLLVTSRERLNLRDEWLLPLGGLALPPDDEGKSLQSAAFAPKQFRSPQPGMEASAGLPGPCEQPAEASNPDDAGYAASSDRSPAEPSVADLLAEPVAAPLDLDAHAATQLFVHCARRVRPDLRPDADAARLIARICRLVDGLPLAIELTAAWVRALPLAEIARRLEGGLDLLATTQRDVPARHRSMRAAFDHSWRLLMPHERGIMRQMSVFRGGCTAEAAEAVAGANLLDLAGLVDKSWLRVEPDGRYGLHELIRQYCAEKLATEHERETGESPDQMVGRHCAYFAAFAAPYEQTFQPPTKTDWQALIPELDNLYAAWLCAIERRDAERLRQLLPFADVNGLLGRNRASLQILEASFEKLHQEWETDQHTDRAPKTALILAWLCQGRTSKFALLDQFTDVLAVAETGLAFLERAERCACWQATFFFLRQVRACAISRLGDPARADRLLSELSDYLGQADAQHGMASPDVTLSRWQAYNNQARSSALSRLGHYAEVLRLLDWLVVQIPETGHNNALAMAWGGLILGVQGDFVEARRRLQIAWDSRQGSGDRDGIATAFSFLADIEAATGEVALAREHFRRGLAIARAIDRNALVCDSLEGLGRLELEMGRPAESAELYHEALAFIERVGMMRDDHTPIVLAGMGRAALAQGRRAEAKEYQRRALRCPVYWVRDRLEAIATLAQVLAAEGNVLRAVELLAFAVAHPATAYRVRQPMTRLLAELEAELPAEQFAVAAARGRARELDEVVAELIGE